MLLAAGEGRRLRPLTWHTPKPLVAVGGKPLLFWHLEALAAAGACKVVINLVDGEDGARQIERAVGDGSRWSLEVLWSRQTGRMDSGGDLLLALPLLGDRPFAVINADVHTDCPLAALLDEQRAPDGTDTLARMVLVPPAPGGGDCALDADDRVRPPGPGRALWTWSGLSVLHPRLLHDPPAARFHVWHDCMIREAAAGRVRGEIHRGHWFDAGTHGRLAQLRALLDRRQGAAVSGKMDGYGSAARGER